MNMENPEFVNLPSRRVKPGQQFREDHSGSDAMFNSTVKMFSMENLGEQVCFRKKKIAREFGEEGSGEGCNRNDFLNQLAVLEGGESEVAVESNSREMEHWLRKLHIRTNHVTEKALRPTMNRLDAVHHAAKTASRLNGSELTTTGDKHHSRRLSHRSITKTETVTPTNTTTETNEEDSSTKPIAARSRGTTKQTIQHGERKTRKIKASRNSGEQPTNEICNTSTIDPSSSKS